MVITMKSNRLTTSFFPTLFFIISICLFSACSGGNSPKNSDPELENSSNTFIDPESLDVISGDEPTVRTPENFSADSNLFICAKILSDAESFRTETTGTVKSFVFTQNIAAKRYVSGGKVFKESLSDGIVKLGEQTFVSGDNYMIRKASDVKSVSEVEWEQSAANYSRESFLDRYGSVQNGLSGYVLNSDTVALATRLDDGEGDLFVFQYVLDSELSTVNIKKEMATCAKSSDFPEFESIELTVTMTDGWLPVSIEYVAEYYVKRLGGVKCVEHLVENFYDIGSVDEINAESFFENFYFNLPSGDNTDISARDIMADALVSGFVKGEQVKAKASVKGIENDEFLPPTFTVKFDGNNEVSAELFGLSVFFKVSDLTNTDFIIEDLNGAFSRFSNTDNIEYFYKLLDSAMLSYSQKKYILLFFDEEYSFKGRVEFKESESGYLILTALFTIGNVEFAFSDFESERYLKPQNSVSISVFSQRYIRPVKEMASGELFSFGLSGKVTENDSSSDFYGNYSLNIGGENDLFELTCFVTDEKKQKKTFKSAKINGNTYVSYDGYKFVAKDNNVKAAFESLLAASDNSRLLAFLNDGDIFDVLLNCPTYGELFDNEIIDNIVYSKGFLNLYFKDAISYIDHVALDTSGKIIYYLNLDGDKRDISAEIITSKGKSFTPSLPKESGFLNVDAIGDAAKVIDATGKYNYFSMNGSLTVNATVESVDLSQSVSISAGLDFVDGKKYFMITATRDYSPIVGSVIYNDKGGITKIYFDGEDKLLIERQMYSGFLGSTLKNNGSLKCTLRQFKDNPVYYLEYILNTSSTVNTEIEKEYNAYKNSTVKIKPQFTSVGYASNKLSVNMLLKRGTENMATLNIQVENNSNKVLKSVSASLTSSGNEFSLGLNLSVTPTSQKTAYNACKNAFS